MQWISQTGDYPTSIVFSENEINIFIELSKEFPLLGNIDPYKDSSITLDYIGFYLEELESIILAYTLNFLKRTDIQIFARDIDFQKNYSLVINLNNKLNKDSSFLMLKRCQKFLTLSKELNSKILIFGV
jgi:hypothetical protein